MAKEIVFEQFDNLTAYARALERDTNKVFTGQSLSSQRKGDGHWAGTKTYEDAMRLFENGWTEKADEIRKAFVKFEKVQQQSVTYEKSRPATSVIGFAPHVPNAILGLPNSMIHADRQPMKAKVVRIIFNMCMNCGTEADDIMNAGLAVLKIVNSLERKGMRVRIDVNMYMAESSKQKTCAIVCVKDWRQPIDIKKVAFPMAHPAMFRRLGFRWLESTPGLTDRGFLSGYGRSIEDVEEAKKFLKEVKVLGDNDYFVNVTLASKHDFDHEEIAKAIGIKNL